MSLNLPEYRDLSDEQLAVMNLELDRNHVIRGAPGTGKSVLALYRAQAALNEGMRVMLIMYNNTLRSYTESAAGQLTIPATRISTLHSWFAKFFEEQFGTPAPRVAAAPGRGWRGFRDFDWGECLRVALSAGGGDRDPDLHVIVDEGQDFPRQAYAFLRFAAATVTVFADENQRISNANSTVSEICDSLGVEGPAELTRNYRNSPEIAMVAAHFDSSMRGGVTQLGGRTRKGGAPRLASAASGQDGIIRIAEYVTNIQRRQPSWDIGVLLPFAGDQAKYYDALVEKGAQGLGLYSSDRDVMTGRAGIDFTQPGVRVVNHLSAKGLEFDLVILAELHRMRNPGEIDFVRKMYVLCSRARLGLVLAYRGALPDGLRQALPLSLLREQTL
jgi:DNA helicase IV